MSPVNQRRKIILASASPQRSQILTDLGVEFEVSVADVEEIDRGEPTNVAVTNALLKARAVAPGFPGALIIGADTVVEIDGDGLGKPSDEDEARSFLGRLSGRDHVVHGGVAILASGQEQTFLVSTTVSFRALDAALIDWYVRSGEWHGRAGGYAIQERGALLVEAVHGDYLNVVGLPLAELARRLPELFLQQ